MGKSANTIRHTGCIRDHVSKNPHNSHGHAYLKKKLNLKIICEIMHSTVKKLQGLMGPAIGNRSFKSIIIAAFLPKSYHR